MTNLHTILQVSHISSTVVRSVEVPIIALIVKPGTSLSMSLILDLVFDSLMRSYRENNCILEEILRTIESNSPVDVKEPERSDDYTKVTYDKEQCLNTLLMGDEVISTIPARETDEFINSSIDDIVLIPREYEVTSDSDLECDMPATTPLPTTNVRGENFDINSPLGEYVVNFLMENEDVAGLPRHLVKQLFSHLLKNPSLTKGMSNEPLGDDYKNLDLYDVTFSNPHFTLMRILLISSETSELFEELIAEFGLDDSIPTKIDDRYHDSR
ncbi:hypothetical protein Tco_1136770 [Tanacetum coccineum]